MWNTGWHSARLIWVAGLVAAVVAGCGGPVGQAGEPSARPRSHAAQAEAARAPTRLTAAITGNPPMLNRDFATGHRRVQGLDQVGKLLNSPLADADEQGNQQPILAEAVPSVENGLWRLLPDGRMETTWKIRQGAAWHDGAPLTADDLVFTSQVVQSADLPLVVDPAWDAVDGIDVVDPRTVVVRWSRPWVNADLMFGNPYPKHLLQQALDQDPAGLPSTPYFGDGFVGTGPFRLREFVRDSHVTMQANDQYVLGRPKIDEIDVRFITDPNTLAANILAGEVQLTLGASVPLELAVNIKDQWADGGLKTRPIDNVIAIWPQHQNPRPAVIGDVRFRRALWQAIDRQLLVDTIQAGLAPIADSKLAPTDAEYQDSQSAVVRYDYDPRAAARAIEDLGYSRGSDGFFRDASGEILSVELRTGGLEVAEKGLFPVRDNWQQVGVKVDTYVIPPQQYQDGEYRATRPGFELSRHAAGVDALVYYDSRTIPGPENHWTGGNKPRYQSVEMDGLLDQLDVTIPRPQRIELLRKVLHLASEQVINLYLFYDVGPTLIGNRIHGVESGDIVGAAHTWTMD